MVTFLPLENGPDDNTRFVRTSTFEGPAGRGGDDTLARHSLPQGAQLKCLDATSHFVHVFIYTYTEKEGSSHTTLNGGSLLGLCL